MSHYKGAVQTVKWFVQLCARVWQSKKMSLQCMLEFSYGCRWVYVGRQDIPSHRTAAWKHACRTVAWNVVLADPRGSWSTSRHVKQIEQPLYTARKFDCGPSQILHDELHWLDVRDRVFFKLAVTVHRCLNGRAPPYLSDYCVPVASALLTLGGICVPPTVNYLQYLVTGLTLTAVGPFQLPAPQSGTLSRLFQTFA